MRSRRSEYPLFVHSRAFRAGLSSSCECHSSPLVLVSFSNAWRPLPSHAFPYFEKAPQRESALHLGVSTGTSCRCMWLHVLLCGPESAGGLSHSECIREMKASLRSPSTVLCCCWLSKFRNHPFRPCCEGKCFPQRQRSRLEN